MIELNMPPTLKEEIDRKSFETINWLIHSYENGQLTVPQFSTGVDALFMAVSGLCDEGIVKLVTETSNEIKADKPAPLKRHFVKNDLLLSLSWEVGSTRITTLKRQGGLAVGSSYKDFDTSAEAKAFFGDIAGSMNKAGYMEL